jgi:ABC-type amino acid transport substrate-binding protein
MLLSAVCYLLLLTLLIPLLLILLLSLILTLLTLITLLTLPILLTLVILLTILIPPPTSNMDPGGIRASEAVGGEHDLCGFLRELHV